MATVEEYLRELLNRKQNNYSYSQNEERAYQYIANLINQWKQSVNQGLIYASKYISIEMQRSGSRAKGDAIKGKSDIDIFISITDPNNQKTVKDYYEELYSFLKPKFATNCLRKQNVSIGISYAGCSIDITPGKRINQHTVINGRSYNDHYIYSRKTNHNTQTNIQKHIDLVRNSGLTNEMMLLKIWRNCHGLELPSIAIEIIAVEVLKNNKSYYMYENIKKVFESLRDTILNRRIIDPSNSNNNIADSMSQSEKEEIRKVAIQSLSYDHGNTVTTNKILW
ncbi:MAG: nucleotidyltransferase domain-containing protein [Roseburia sp.]|nr:nucleotidyltransferase domain-containing protein [Roseburia sp.]